MNKIYRTLLNHSRLIFSVYGLMLFIVFDTNASSKGYLLNSDPHCKVWWVESTYKIFRDDPVPDKKGRVIIRSAKNETESFQLVLSPVAEINGITVTVSNFSAKDGSFIPSENITIRNVEYVHVTKPSGKLHKAGWYPDPLPVHEKPFSAVSGVNTPLWFTVKIPGNAIPGKYTATVLLKSASWETTVPVELYVWDFVLPDIPSMRSGFGLNTGLIKRYHNLETEEELEQVTDKYLRSFKDYKISPYGSYPVRKTVKGVRWSGGTFDPVAAYAGKYSYQVTDNSTGANVEAKYTEWIEIDPKHPYLLKWQAKTLVENQKYTVTVQCYDDNKNPIHWSLKWIVYEGSTSWRQDTLFIDTDGFFTFEDLPDYRPFPENARYASVHLYASLPERDGSGTGTVWFDNFEFVDVKSGRNLLTEGNFEPDISALDVELDFSAFDKAAKRYLDELGFTGFRVTLPELRPGPYVGKKTGWFSGFIHGTPEYEKLIGLYLKGFQDHLEANGWLGKEYLYWVDEPKHEDYDFVREGMNTIHRVAPKLTRFITENNPGPEIMDVTETGCPVFYKVEPEKVKEYTKKGRQFWSYLMCWPKEPHVNLFIDSDAINLRMWIWMTYQYNLTGILVWQSNHWNRSAGAAPDGMLQNIWEDPMSYKSGYGTPYGSAPEFGNGDGMFFYPPNRDPNHDKTKYLTGPVPSVRIEILREGLDDYEYMMMLEDCIENAQAGRKDLVKKAKGLLNFGPDVFVNDTQYIKDPKILMEYRRQMGELLEQFYRSRIK